MAYITPWMTSTTLVESIQRKIMLPLAQNTFLPKDILAMANEEMMIGLLPSVMEYHEEYYVYRYLVPIGVNQSRYGIPNRAIGMKLNDVMWSDDNNNLCEMTRVDGGDRAYFQQNVGANQALHKFYVEGNDIVLTPDVSGNPTGNLNFFMYIRPNQLVDVSRAATITNFIQNITIDNTTLVAGDAITIQNVTFTATSGSVVGNEFLIGGTNTITATNLSNAINTNGVTSSSVNNNIISIDLPHPEDIFKAYSTNIQAFLIDTTSVGFQFDSLPASYTDPYTNVTTPLFVEGAIIDMLQTNPGHKIYTFDKTIESIDGNIAYFSADDLLTHYNENNPNAMWNISIGDYICLANECIIPQVPTELHTALAERTASRILASIGDTTGLQVSTAKLEEIKRTTGQLVDNRVENAPRKVKSRYSPLSMGRIGGRRRV